MDSANFPELGFRREVTPLTMLGLAFGVGVDNDSPRFRVTFAFQHSLGSPWYPKFLPARPKEPK